MEKLNKALLTIYVRIVNNSRLGFILACIMAIALAFAVFGKSNPAQTELMPDASVVQEVEEVEQIAEEAQPPPAEESTIEVVEPVIEEPEVVEPNYTTYDSVTTDALQNVDNKATTVLDMCCSIKDAAAMKKAGIDLVCLRCTRKNGKLDESFWSNYKALRKAGIDVDVYKYSYATSVEEAREEAEYVVYRLKGAKLKDQMIWLDMETDFYINADAKTVQAMANAFIDACKEGGYNCGIYCSLDMYTYKDHFVGFNLDCPFWIAAWSANTSKVQSDVFHKVARHQTEAGERTSKKISGVYNGTADLNVSTTESTLVGEGVTGDGEYATVFDKKYAGVYTPTNKAVKVRGTSDMNSKDNIIAYVEPGYQLTCWGYYGKNEDGVRMMYVEFFDVEHGVVSEGFVSSEYLKKIMDISNVQR